MRARTVGLVIGALLSASSVQAGNASDPMADFRAELAFFQMLPADSCGPPFDADDKQEVHERGVFGQAENALVATLSAQPEGESKIPAVLQALVDGSKEINASWPDETRFHYKLYHFPSLLIVQATFRNQTAFFAFGKPKKTVDGKPWEFESIGGVENRSPYNSADMTILKPAANGNARFLIRRMSNGCAGNLSGVTYEGFQWDPSAILGLTQILSQDGVTNLNDYEQIKEIDSAGKPLGTQRIVGIGKFQLARDRLTLPYCKTSAVDWWDYATLCYVDTYDLSQGRLQYVSTEANRPDLNTIAKVIEFVHAHDLQALIGYTTSETVARQLLEANEIGRAEMGYGVKHVSSSEEMLFSAEDAEGGRFSLKRANGRWLVSGFQEQSCNGSQ